jgi:hypothetical protein
MLLQEGSINLWKQEKVLKDTKTLVIGEDPHDNSSETDKIELQDKAVYLIAALRFAFNNHPKKHGQNAVSKPVKPAVH